MAFELKRNKNIKEVWGIEPVKKAGEVARGRLDKTLIMTIEEAIPLLPDGKFDTIIFADVLEHLVDPEGVLINLKSKLAPGGEIFASIPNIRHWYIFQQLLQGDWEYSEHGLLDKTHLRFFTKKSIVRMFKKCGYQPALVKNQKFGNYEIPDAAIELLTNAGFDTVALQEEINDFQYFFRAVTGEIAFLAPSHLITKLFLSKLSSFPIDIQQEIKMTVVYDSPTPMIEYIKSFDDPNDMLTAKHKSELNIQDYAKIVLFDGIEFDVGEVTNHYTNFNTESLFGRNFVVTSKDCVDFQEIYGQFMNSIR